MKKNALLIRIVALGMALVMLCTACGDSAKASSMRLMKTKGNVGILNGEGERLSPEEEMRLYSGYRLSTQRRSYAWINLDSVKLSKMDASSEVEIQKNGKDLEIIIKEGKLFFNVTEPLGEDEHLNIRTSTMSVGIRGTCGWVEVDEDENVKAYILEGRVECAAVDPNAEPGSGVAVAAGEVASFSQGETEIQVEAFEGQEVRPFVLEELAEDEALLEKIREDSGLDIQVPDAGTPDSPVDQAMDEFQRALSELEGGSLKERIDDAIKEAAGADRDDRRGSGGDLLSDYQGTLVEGMLKGRNGQEKDGNPGWLQALTDTFAPDNLEGSLSDGSEAVDYMQIRMGRNVNCYKPNLYLYGEAGTTMKLLFSSPMLLTRTIPEYTDGWAVELAEDGSLTVDGEGGYPYLFYESVTLPGIFQTKEGFFVEAADRRARLEEILSGYGLNRQEIQDFVEFWDGFLDKDTDYVMYPQTTETVDGAMPLEILGTRPDHYFRLWFCFRARKEGLAVPALPHIVPASHEGTALVEWGGMVF